MIVALIITAVVLSILTGFSKAICDLSEEGKLKFKNYFFWWKDYAWKNKWKLKDNGVPVLKNGQYIPKFWQSDNLFVIFTDAWHLFGFIMRVTFGISFIIVGYLAGAVSLYYLFGALINYIVFIGIFHIFHTYKILKK